MREKRTMWKSHKLTNRRQAVNIIDNLVVEQELDLTINLGLYCVLCILGNT